MMTVRKLTEHEYNYMWYIEYGAPYHYIPTPPEIGQTIKTLIAEGMLIQLPNPTLEKSPMYTRFTKAGRMLFLAHEWMLDFKHPTEWEIGYENALEGYSLEGIMERLKHMLR